MTELIILCAFAPLIFLPFPAFRRLTQVWGWSAVVIAVLCHGYGIFLHYQEPLLWIPAASFLSVFVINLAAQRYRRGLSTLAVLFVSQALLARQFGIHYCSSCVVRHLFGGGAFFIVPNP